MSKISIYPIISSPTLGDYLIGTDVNNSLNTKNFLLSDILNLAGSVGYIPYVGATQDADFGSYGINVDYLSFNLSPVSLAGPGKIVYDSATGALSYKLNNSSVVSQIGQTIHVLAYNAEGFQINKGQPVYAYNASSDSVSVKVAFNQSSIASSNVLGLAAEDIGAGQSGMIITLGVLSGIDTSSLSVGNVYLGPTAGTFTNVKPFAPNSLVYIGVVEKSDVTDGQIYVNVQNGLNIEELHNVSAQSPSNNDIIAYSTATSLWQKTTIPAVLGYTPEDAANKGIPNGYAPLNGINQIDAIYLPSYVDDVQEYPNFASFPIPGMTGIIYVDLSTNNIYRWGGTLYVLISDNTAVWGSIGGTLSSQLDLNAALNSKVNSSRSISTSSPLSGGGDLSVDRTISISQSTSVTDGYLSFTDWNTFNNKVSSSRSISTSSPLSGGGDLSVDRTISISQSTSVTDGYLSFTDWNTFNNKVSSSRSISTSSPLSGGGNLSADRTISISQASSITDGYLSFTDWNTFNNKVGTARSISTASPLTGGGDLSLDRTIGINNAAADSGTKGAATFKTADFNDDGNGLISIDYVNGQSASSVNKGFLTSADWSTFNGKQDAITLTTTGTSGAATFIGNTLNIPEYAGTPIAVLDDGSTITSSVESIDFVGDNVTATAIGNDVTVTITGGTPPSAKLFNYYNFI